MGRALIVSAGANSNEYIAARLSEMGYSRPVIIPSGAEARRRMSLHANVYKYAIYYALCAETSKYGTLQRYMCDTDPTTEIRQSTFSRYSSTPSDTPDEPETPSCNSRSPSCHSPPPL